MKKIIILISLSCATFVSFAQLGMPISMYSGNQMIYNPAYAGINDMLAIHLTARKMWVQIPGAPMQVSFNAHAPLENDKHAIGLVLQQERWGPMVGSFGYAGYAYKIFFGESVLSLGVQAGFLSSIIHWDKIDYVKDDDDPGLRTGRTNSTYFDANVGAYYYGPNLFVGFSAKHLAQPEYDNIDINGVEWYSKMRSQFFLTAGYRFELSETWSLTPMAMVRYVHTIPTSFNLSLQLGYSDVFSVGSSWLSGQKSISFFAKARVAKGLEIGYAYDTYYGAIRSYQKGSHEILLSYCLESLWGY